MQRSKAKIDVDLVSILQIEIGEIGEIVTYGSLTVSFIPHCLSQKAQMKEDNDTPPMIQSLHRGFSFKKSADQSF